MLEQPVLGGLHPMEGDPHLEQFLKNYSLWEGFMLEKFLENCFLYKIPHGGAGEGLLRKKEQQRLRVMN